MRTFIEDFYTGSERTPYASELVRTAGSVGGKVWAVTVLLDVYPTHFHLVRLRVPRKFSGRGYGSKTLQWLCRLADKHALDVRLQVSSNHHKALSDADLQAWYVRNGFLVRGQWMIRKPKGR